MVFGRNISTVAKADKNPRAIERERERESPMKDIVWIIMKLLGIIMVMMIETCQGLMRHDGKSSLMMMFGGQIV